MKYIFWLLVVINTSTFACNLNHDDASFFTIDNFSFRNIMDEEEVGISRNFITIGLGSNCHPAWYTRLNNIRTSAFPFDWCITPLKALCHFIEHDFKDYLKKENLVPSSSIYFTDYLQDFLQRLSYSTISETKNWVLDKASGMIYNHDFPSNSPRVITQHYELQYSKYLRRIKRFYQEINSGKYIYFIRFHDITQSEAQNLYLLLKKKFPKTPFTLIVIGNNSKEFGSNWGMSGIKNFYSVGDDKPFWQKLCQDIFQGNLQVKS